MLDLRRNLVNSQDPGCKKTTTAAFLSGFRSSESVQAVDTSVITLSKKASRAACPPHYAIKHELLQSTLSFRGNTTTVQSSAMSLLEKEIARRSRGNDVCNHSAFICTL